MNLKRYLKQTVSWERKTGESDWGDPAFDDPVTLPARVEENQRRVRNAAGVEVLSNTRVMLEADASREVSLGDRIDGLEVQARESLVDLGGRIAGWTVYL